MNRQLRCAIVGFGYMGEIRRQVVDRHPRLELVGVCETSEAKRSTIQDCRLFRDWDEVARHAPDIVFVCTPNRYSSDLCIKALDLGAHVFCEKPPGRTVEDVRRIIQAERGGCKLMFGFNHRFHPGIMQAKAIIDSKRLGSIIGLRGVYGKSGGVTFQHSWRNDAEVSGGGILLDQGIHMLDLFRHFCGEFEEVKCFLGNSFWRFELEDNAFVILRNRRGQSASLHSSATLWKHTFRIEIMLEHAYMTVEGLLSKTGSYGRERLIVGKRQFEDEATAVGNPSEEITYFDRDDSWDREVAEFVRCIDDDRPVTSGSSADALGVMEIVSKAYQDAGASWFEPVRHEA